MRNMGFQRDTHNKVNEVQSSVSKSVQNQTLHLKKILREKSIYREADRVIDRQESLIVNIENIKTSRAPDWHMEICIPA